MERRAFVKSLAAVGISSALPLSALASVGKTTGVNIQTLFNSALTSQPELIGYAGVENNFSPKQLKIEGKLPVDLQGMFVKNGPARHERGDIRYQHLFEGDGMLQQFVIADGKITHQGRFVETPKYKKEQDANQFLYSGADTRLSNSLPISSADVINTANTNVIPVNNELWALWEAGSATAVDKDTLAYKEQVNLGEGSAYGNKLKGLPFSAHPKIDPNGDIWNFGLHPSGHIVVYHLNSKGSLKKFNMVKSGYKGGMLHDFVITQDYVLLILPSLVRDRSKHGLFGSITMDANLPMRVLVLDKNTLTTTKEYELPPGFAFHFGNAWQDAQGSIHFDASLYQSIGILHELSDLMSGKRIPEPTHGYTTLFSLHKNGSVSQKAFDAISEFPRVCPHLTGLQNRYLFHVSSGKDKLWNNELVAIDLKKDKVNKFAFGDDYMVEEHIPICPTNEEGKGYLIGVSLHVPSKRSCLNVFDMANVTQGPIARAWLPYHLPLGFHGNFISA